MQIDRKTILLSLFILLSPAVYFCIGLPLPTIAKDAAQYHSYAVNLVTGHGYSVDGTAFSTLREPGYPFFLAAVYKIFGVGNLYALVAVQTLLLGILGVLIYRLFVRLREEHLGLIAGLAVCLLPGYGLYAHTMSTELLFAVLLGVLFYCCARVALAGGNSRWYWYAGIGFISGYTTLVRAQFIFFLPFLILCAFVFLRPVSWEKMLKFLLAGTVCITVVGSWVLYAHQKTGIYTITSGRPEVVLYMRAVRAQLSYTQLTRYGYDWVRRSITGGTGTSFLMDNEFAKLGLDYNRLASTSASIVAVKKQNIATLIANPGHYLYGNLIEAIKLGWIEHDYGDFLNRYFRAGIYLVLYGLFLFGIMQLKYRKQERGITAISVLALFFIAYNYLVLTFFDTIPRYNTPYLVFYLVTGVAGIALWRRRASREVSAQRQ